MTTVLRDTRRGWLMLICFVVAEVTFLAVSVLVLLPFALMLRHGAAGTHLPGGALVAALLVPTVAAGVVAATGAVLLAQGKLLERLRSQLSVRWRLQDAGLGLALGVVGLVVTVPASALWRTGSAAATRTQRSGRCSTACGCRSGWVCCCSSRCG